MLLKWLIIHIFNFHEKIYKFQKEYKATVDNLVSLSAKFRKELKWYF